MFLSKLWLACTVFGYHGQMKVGVCK